MKNVPFQRNGIMETFICSDSWMTNLPASAIPRVVLTGQMPHKLLHRTRIMIKSFLGWLRAANWRFTYDIEYNGNEREQFERCASYCWTVHQELKFRLKPPIGQQGAGVPNCGFRLCTIHIPASAIARQYHFLSNQSFPIRNKLKISVKFLN